MSLSSPLAQYSMVTANYWVFTLTDGALRMLVLLFFHQLGYSPLQIAMLFLLYELFGIITNLLGGWLGAHLGLKVTMNLGLALQIIALLMLAVDPSWLSVVYVMIAQALSGIAKDLNKMSAKSSIKSLTSEQDGQLFKWVAYLTGSKNALKGVGFFLGAVLLETVGFSDAMLLMAAMLVVIWLVSLFLLNSEIGKAKQKQKFSEIFSKSQAINQLSAARFFLFGARDVWFVVALPLYLVTVLEWDNSLTGAYMALWVIGYGFIQASAPAILGIKKGQQSQSNPTAMTAKILAFALASIPVMMAFTLALQPQWILVIGLIIFGAVFALNSAVHSYLIVSYADADGTSKDVGFYYMANAAGRLVGTLLSGYVYQAAGMEACLLTAAVFVLLAGLLAGRIQPTPAAQN